MEFVVVCVTAGSPEEAARLARTLVEERLAACVNRLSPVRSTYRWQGAIEESEEELLVIKTAREIFPDLEQRIRELHSYAVPEILALPVVDGSAAYLRWLEEQVSPKPGS